ncbi:MAG: ATP synthase F0 subunit B [Deltaproteobacteria bacterium]|nr:ATP synthase F0 subunit B [Deltaproteobacteria bacterium]
MDGKQALEFGLYVLNFAVFLWLIIRFAGRKLRTYLQNRKEEIRKEMEEAEKIHASAEARLNEIDRKLKEIDEQKNVLFDEFRSLGENERDKIIKESVIAAEKIKQEVGFLMQQDFKKLKQELEKELIEKTIERVRSELAGARGEKVHGEYLKFFVNKDWWKNN